MKATIEIESLQQAWQPPFTKKRDVESFTVNAGETLETTRDGTPLFTIQSVEGDRVLLQYNRLYTLKGYEHPTERKLWLTLHTPVKFSSLWEDNGMTKTVTLRGVSAGSTSSEESVAQMVEATPSETPTEHQSEEMTAETAMEEHIEETEKSPVTVESSHETEIYRPTPQ